MSHSNGRHGHYPAEGCCCCCMYGSGRTGSWVTARRGRTVQQWSCGQQCKVRRCSCSSPRTPGPDGPRPATSDADSAAGSCSTMSARSSLWTHASSSQNQKPEARRQVHGAGQGPDASSGGGVKRREAALAQGRGHATGCAGVWPRARCAMCDGGNAAGAGATNAAQVAGSLGRSRARLWLLGACGGWRPGHRTPSVLPKKGGTSQPEGAELQRWRWSTGRSRHCAKGRLQLLLFPNGTRPRRNTIHAV